MLICPACRHALVETRTSSNESLLTCLECGGRGIKIATLAKVLSPLTFRRLISGYSSSHVISSRGCPECRTRMKKVPLTVLGQTKTVEICGHSELAWFDPRELENLPLTSDAQTELALPSYVREALHQIETHHGKVIKNRSSFRLDASDYGFGQTKPGDNPIGAARAMLSFVLMLPIKIENRLARKPWANWITIAVILAVTMHGFSNYSFMERWALSGDEMFRAGGFTLVTYFFLHGSWVHVLGNLYYLLFFGDSVEDEFGATKLLITFFAGTIGAGLAHAVFSPAGGGVLVGASGGISTLGMVYMLAFPRARLGFYLLVGWLKVPAYLLCAIWIYMQVQLAYQQVAGLTQVSALAHLGGALVGAILYFTWLRRPLHERATNT